MISTKAWLIMAATFIVAVLLPYLLPVGLGDWAIRLTTLILIAVSWNMMANAGLISLGHAGFWGLGAYTAALFANSTQTPFWLSLIPALLIGALFGGVLAFITGRLRGLFFAISTLAMAEALRVVALMVPSLTGGAEGEFLADALRPSREMLASFALGLTVIAVAISYIISKSRYHYALRAMRDSESAVQMLGVNPAKFRIGLTAVSGAMAAGAGMISAWYTGYLEPGAAFDLKNTISSQIAPLFGGLYTVAGPVLGSIALLAISEITRLQFGTSAGVALFAYGIVLVCGVLFMPSGIVGLYRAWKRKRPAIARQA
ncbi:MAG: branched-chain amino acid ABC transporter permease [Pseudorhodoplanes sp.]